MQPLLTKLYESGHRKISPSELASTLGSTIEDDKSILRSAYKNSIPIIIPGITDGAVGSQLWIFSEQHRDFSIDVLEDERILSRLTFENKYKKSGALIIGGGISKHHTLWWTQFRGGLDYAIYLTTAPEFDGSLSGALTREAISWGKIAPTAKQVNLYGDATLILPFLVSALEI
jgi:deoxyhypusine synthase